MSRSIRAHFDGKAIIPDEPVDLPINQPLRVRVENGLPAERGRRSMNAADVDAVTDRLQRLKSITGIVTGPPIDPEALRRENLYDDRL